MSDQTIEGKLIVTDRVGIGTERPEPETQLHISPTNKDGKIYLESGGNLLQVIVSSTIATIGTSGSFPLQLQANLNQSKFSGIYISNGGNIGIGTTTPSFNLDVQGTINATQFNKNGQRWKITDDDIDDNTISGKKIKPQSISQDKLDFTIGGSQWISGSSSSISYNSGNVGIGNSSPSFNLDVAGIINATQFNKNGQRWKITDDDIDDNTISGKKIKPRSISQDKLDFTIGGSQWVSGSSGSISYSDGNVGIGKSPTVNLDVQGTINATQFNKNGSPWIISRNEIASKAINADKIDDGAVSDIKIANNAVTKDKIPDKSITKEKLAFDISPGGGSSQWQGADGGPIFYTKGNVGVGTKNPQTPLHISTSQTTLRIQSTQPTQNGLRGGKARIEFWSDPQSSKTEWQQAVIESSDSDDLKRAFGGVLSFYVNRSSGDVNDNQIRPKKVMSMTENRVDVTGELYVNGKLVQSSSRYLKESITDFSTEEAIEALASLNPVKFNYRDDNDKKLNVGFIAEDVPEFVATSDRKALSALDIVAVLTKVIKEQQQELSLLRERVNSLETKST